MSQDTKAWELPFQEIAGENPRIDPFASLWNEEAFLLSSLKPGPVSPPFHAGELKNLWSPDGPKRLRYQYAAAPDTAHPRILLMSRDVDESGTPLSDWSPVGEYDGENLGIVLTHRGAGAGSSFLAYLLRNGQFRGPSIGYSPAGLASLRRAHRDVVLSAILAGEEVPTEVLDSHPDLPITPDDVPTLYYHGTTRGAAKEIAEHGFCADLFGTRDRGPAADAEYRGVYLTKDRVKAESYYSTISDKPNNEVLGGGDVLVVRIPEDKLCPPHLWRGFLTEAKIATLDENGEDAPRQVVLDEQVRLARQAGYVGTTTRGGTETIVFNPSAIEVVTWYEPGSVPRLQDGSLVGEKRQRRRQAI